MLRVEPTGPLRYAQLEELQRIVFPTLADEQRFKAAHYAAHVAQFPDGQLCVVDDATDRAVGMTSTIRLDVDLAHPHHTFAEIIQGGFLASHQPEGRWLYGADVGTDPEYRRRGIARALYAARQELVRRLNLLGQVTVGMPSGYGALQKEMPAARYVEELSQGRRSDPTISAQLRIGFQIRGLIPGYIHDPICGGYGVVLALPAAAEVRFPP